MFCNPKSHMDRGLYLAQAFKKYLSKHKGNPIPKSTHSFQGLLIQHS